MDTNHQRHIERLRSIPEKASKALEKKYGGNEYFERDASIHALKTIWCSES